MQTEAGASLPGATVIIKGTYAGNSTNEEGLFQLKADFSKGPAVLLTNSKDPFKDPGLSVRVRGGNHNLLDGQLRYAQKIGERGAFKISGGATVADDFIADDQAATSALIEPANNAAASGLGYDAVSR